VLLRPPRLVRCSIATVGDADNGFHVRPRGRLNELPRIGIQGLEIAPLTLCKQNVERQTALAAAGNAGDHRELVATQLHVDILEVVLSGAVDLDAVGRVRPRGGGFGVPYAQAESGRQLGLAQRATGVRSGRLHHVLRRTHANHAAAGVAAFRSQIDDPIGRSYEIEVVFDHQHRMSGIDEASESAQQLCDIVEMQTGRWFVEQE